MSDAETSYNICNNKLEDIKQTIKELIKHPKGILSGDDSTEFIGVRLKESEIENTEENRRLFRQLLFQSNISEFISGVIMNHEAFYQRNDDAIRFTSWLADIGILTGIRVDTGIYKVYKGSREYLTEGLDNITERLALFKNEGCRFAKWRSAYIVTSKKPSSYCIDENIHFMSRFAAVAQSKGIAPILSVEIIPEGDHSIERSRSIVEKILLNLLTSLSDYDVCIEGVLMEINMIRPGEKSESPCSTEEIAKATVTALERTLPPALPGILLRGGGLSEEEATITLQEIVNLRKEPWKISFNFGDALQESALQVWMGKADNVSIAQEELQKRAKANSLALQGEYELGSVEGAASGHHLYRKEEYLI